MNEAISIGLNEAIEFCQDVAANPPEKHEILLPIWDDCGRLIHFSGVAARLSVQTRTNRAADSTHHTKKLEMCLNCVLDVDMQGPCICDNTELSAKPPPPDQTLRFLDNLTYDLKRYRDKWLAEFRHHRQEAGQNEVRIANAKAGIVTDGGEKP